MKYNLTINIKYIFFVICIYLLVFQNLIQNYIPIIQYFDECLALFYFPILLLSRKSNKNENNKLLSFSLILLLFIGLISNVLYKYQSLNFVFSDILIYFKFYLVLLLSEKLWNLSFFEKNNKKIKFHINFIAFLLLLFTILNYVFVLWPSEIRYGIMANKLFYSHPTFLAGICVFLLCLSLRVNRKILSKNNIVILIVLLSTLRIKAIGAALAIMLFSLYIEKNNKKMSISKIIIVGLFLIFLCFDQINYYFFANDGFARKELLFSSLKIAKDFFPLGSGFATFGSYYSGVNYSPIYYLYNLNNIYGIQPNYHPFIADSFYPMLIGQFGYIGIILFGISLYAIFKKISKLNLNTSKYEYISKISALIYLIISSTSESGFAGPMALSLALILGFNDFSNKEI